MATKAKYKLSDLLELDAAIGQIMKAKGLEFKTKLKINHMLKTIEIPLKTYRDEINAFLEKNNIKQGDKVDDAMREKIEAENTKMLETSVSIEKLEPFKESEFEAAEKKGADLPTVVYMSLDRLELLTN